MKQAYTRVHTLIIVFLSMCHATHATDDVVVTAKNNGCDSFFTRVQSSGLYEHAKKDVGADGSMAPLTVFVPSNAAMASIQNMDQNKAKKIITYHVVPNKTINTPGTEMKTGVPTVGETMLFADGTTIFLEDSPTKARITGGPITAKNGLIYLIDTVLLPKGATPTATTPPAPMQQPAPVQQSAPVQQITPQQPQQAQQPQQTQIPQQGTPHQQQ